MTAPHSTTRLVRSLLRGYPWLAVAAAVVAVAAAALGLVVDALGSGVERSVWEYADDPARWVLFVIGILLAVVVLPTYVAHGVTRGRFTLAGTGFGAVLASLVALYLAAGFLIERAVFAAAGRPHTFADEHLFTTAFEVHLVLAEYAVLGAAYLVAGWLVGICYYRFGGWRGTLALPLTTLPLFTIENVVGTGQWTGLLPDAAWRAIAEWPPATTAALVAVVLAAGLAALRALTRTVPINARKQS